LVGFASRNLPGDISPACAVAPGEPLVEQAVALPLPAAALGGAAGAQGGSAAVALLRVEVWVAAAGAQRGPLGAAVSRLEARGAAGARHGSAAVEEGPTAPAALTV
jgi:hypothetical protein